MICDSIVWFRRDLRLYDHTSLASAIHYRGKILPIFIFDEEILKRFKNKKDFRLSFLAETIININKELKKYKGELLILHGKASQITANLAQILKCNQVFASLDYEHETRERDNQIKINLKNIDFILEEDHMIMPVNSILKKDRTPYKVYTAYKNAWLSKIDENYSNERKIDLSKANFIDISSIREKLKNFKIISFNNKESLLTQIGYEPVDLPKYWSVDNADDMINKFIVSKLKNYKIKRDYMGVDGTSRLSPYIRHGLISIRKCYRAASNNNNGIDWINELIWRDFYKMILYYYPLSSKEEFKQVYRNNIAWEDNQSNFEAWCEGKTGYPLVDAAMRQLKDTGWMHNRMRMITASFLSKHLLIDWRKGEEHFAQYLLDYDLSSNVGGWQWCASTGNDSQPYFRVFNPSAQGKKFDAEAKYVKKFVPELKKIPAKYIYEPKKFDKSIKYPDPIVEHKEARIRAIRKFKEAKT